LYDPEEIGIVFAMDKKELISYLEQIDQRLNSPTSLCIYGSAAFILLDEPDRTSLDIDVAGPYSKADLGELRQAAERAGLPFNPEESSRSDHLEWISGLRLCLAAPQPESEILLWSGRCLTVKTVSVPDLIASKLIRYDEIDQSDIEYLVMQQPIKEQDIHSAVHRLPSPFSVDTIVLDNFDLLKQDMKRWKGT
jgi:hypothetical protein